MTLAVAYIALAGPGLYFFLKQRDLREYYQPAVALIAICTTGMVILMGTGTRFKGPFFTYATIENTSQTDKTETTFINMRAPYNKTYSVELNPQYRLYPVTGSPYYDQIHRRNFSVKEKQISPSAMGKMPPGSRQWIQGPLIPKFSRWSFTPRMKQEKVSQVRSGL